MADAVHPDDAAVTASTDASPPKKKHGRKLLALLKGTTRGGVETMLGTDRLKAAAGAQHAKNRLGVLETGKNQPSGPVDFPARYRGKKGHAYITTTATTPALSWTTEAEDIDPIFTIAIQDIKVCLHLLQIYDRPHLIENTGTQESRWTWLESKDNSRVGNR
jgi:hypothetical protein